MLPIFSFFVPNKSPLKGADDWTDTGARGTQKEAIDLKSISSKVAEQPAHETDFPTDTKSFLAGSLEGLSARSLPVSSVSIYALELGDRRPESDCTQGQ